MKKGGLQKGKLPQQGASGLRPDSDNLPTDHK